MTASSNTPSSAGWKNLAVFLDGTWDTVDDNTNVWRIKSLCAPIAADGRQQLSYYSVGVGTSVGEKFRGGVLGYGVDHVVRNAYQWLIENYDPGDDIFLFGFSRGAFEARSLAGLISRYGILRRGSPLGVTQLFDRYKLGFAPKFLSTINNATRDNDKTLTTEERWLHKYSRDVGVNFIGVWDTVGALGLSLPIHIPGVSDSSFKFYDPNLRQNYKHAFHALAIDEQRVTFAPTLWTKLASNNAPDRDLASVEQRWFAGTHGNVGGGYKNDILPQLSLRWIMNKAETCGLRFLEMVAVDDDFRAALIPDSRMEFLHGLYAALEKPFYRAIGAAPQPVNDTTSHSINETIDASVFERWNFDPLYRPRNLVEWEQRKGVDIKTLSSSVRADEPSIAAEG